MAYFSSFILVFFISFWPMIEYVNFFMSFVIIFDLWIILLEKDEFLMNILDSNSTTGILVEKTGCYLISDIVILLVVS
jgi:hypothetical protein